MRHPLYGEGWPSRPEPVSLIGFVPPQPVVRLVKSHYLPQAQYERFLTASGEGVPHVAYEQEMD